MAFSPAFLSDHSTTTIALPGTECVNGPQIYLSSPWRHVISSPVSITFSLAKWRLSLPMWGLDSFQLEGKFGHFGLCWDMLLQLHFMSWAYLAMKALYHSPKTTDSSIFYSQETFSRYSRCWRKLVIFKSQQLLPAWTHTIMHNARSHWQVGIISLGGL